MLTFICACYASRWGAHCKNCEVIFADFDGWHSKGKLCEWSALVVLRQQQQGLVTERGEKEVKNGQIVLNTAGWAHLQVSLLPQPLGTV